MTSWNDTPADPFAVAAEGAAYVPPAPPAPPADLAEPFFDVPGYPPAPVGLAEDPYSPAAEAPAYETPAYADPAFETPAYAAPIYEPQPYAAVPFEAHQYPASTDGELSTPPPPPPYPFPHQDGYAGFSDYEQVLPEPEVPAKPNPLSALLARRRNRGSEQPEYGQEQIANAAPGTTTPARSAGKVKKTKGDAGGPERAGRDFTETKEPRGNPFALLKRTSKSLLGLAVGAAILVGATYVLLGSTLLAISSVDGTYVAAARNRFPEAKAPAGTLMLASTQPDATDLLGRAQQAVMGLSQPQVVEILAHEGDQIAPGRNGTVLVNGITLPGVIAKDLKPALLGKFYLAACAAGPCGARGSVFIFSASQGVGEIVKQRGSAITAPYTSLPSALPGQAK